MPCLAPAALGLVELCKNWRKWRKSRDFVVFLFLETFEYNWNVKKQEKRQNTMSKLFFFKGYCCFSCFLTFFCNKKCPETGETPKSLFQGILLFLMFSTFFCYQKCPGTGKSLENNDFFQWVWSFSVFRHFWIQKVSLNRRNDKIPWQ